MSKFGAQEPFSVKNTFIEVGNDFFEDESLEASFQAINCKRQVSEPAFIFARQVSRQISQGPSTLVPVKESYNEAQQLSPIVQQLVPQPAVASAAAAISAAAASASGPSGSMPGRQQQSDSSGCEEPETETEPHTAAAALHDPSGFVMNTAYAPQVSALNANAVPWTQPTQMRTPEPSMMSSHMLQVSPNVVPQAQTVGMLGNDHHQQTDIPSDWSEVLTVMMRNLPNRYTQQMLLEEISNVGFAGCFDFFYLPIDPETAANKGYAFINFVLPEHAWRFKVNFEGKQMARFNSSKYVSVSPAALQGLEANFAHYSTARCSRGDPAARPIFLREPTQLGQRGQGNNRRGGQRRRNNGRSLVDVAAQRQVDHRQPQQQQQQPLQQMPLQQMPQIPAEQLQQMQGGQESNRAGGEAGREGKSLVAKFCPFCGGSVLPTYRFCQYCGASQGSK